MLKGAKKLYPISVLFPEISNILEVLVLELVKGGSVIQGTTPWGYSMGLLHGATPWGYST